MQKENNYKPTCPECQSIDFRKAGFKLLSKRKLQQYQCNKCGRIYHE